MTPPTPLAAWIGKAKAGLDQGALSTRKTERDLKKALAMLDVVEERMQFDRERRRRSTWRQHFRLHILDQLDVMAREAEP